jgi:hypothetical protein
MLHRERMAMIERGLIPPPEVDPAGHEVGRAFVERALSGEGGATTRLQARYMTAGITVMGFGVAMMFIICLTAGQVRVGLGVGGAFMAIGVAFVANSFSPRR